MIAPYFVFLVLLPWCVACDVGGSVANGSLSAGLGLGPGPDLFLMLWVYLFLRLPRGNGGFLLWLCGIAWDVFFGGQLGLGGLIGLSLWWVRSLLQLGDPLRTPLPRHPLPQGMAAGIAAMAVGIALGVAQASFAGVVKPFSTLLLQSLIVGLWTVLCWWPFAWLTGSLARLFTWNPDWVADEGAQA